MAVETVTAPVIDTTPEPAHAEPETSSLADHEAQFARGGMPSADDEADEEPHQGREGRDDRGRFKHRAASQRATADDVAAINALTKELRTKEAEWAKAHPDEAGDSPRIRALKRQIKALDADLKPASTRETSTPAPHVIAASLSAPVETSTAAGAFTEPKPTIASLIAAGVADPYEALTDAILEWRDRKAAHEQGLAKAADAKAKNDAETVRIATQFDARMKEAAKARPNWDTVTQAVMTRELPMLLTVALALDDKSGDYVYYLGQHPDLLDELVFDTDGKPITDAHVATVQRRLKQHAQAATTGSAAVARPVTQPPKPPNPVRTGPIRTGDDLPGDDASLAEHERAFGPKSRR